MCWSVEISDHRRCGGTCTLRGCDPKKMLIAATEVIDGFERMGGTGNHTVLVDSLLETKETAEVINPFGFARPSGLIADALRYTTFAYP